MKNVWTLTASSAQRSSGTARAGASAAVWAARGGALGWSSLAPHSCACSWRWRRRERRGASLLRSRLTPAGSFARFTHLPGEAEDARVEEGQVVKVALAAGRQQLGHGVGGGQPGQWERGRGGQKQRAGGRLRAARACRAGWCGAWHWQGTGRQRGPPALSPQSATSAPLLRPAPPRPPPAACCQPQPDSACRPAAGDVLLAGGDAGELEGEGGHITHSVHVGVTGLRGAGRGGRGAGADGARGEKGRIGQAAPAERLHLRLGPSAQPQRPGRSMCHGPGLHASAPSTLHTPAFAGILSAPPGPQPSHPLCLSIISP